MNEGIPPQTPPLGEKKRGVHVIFCPLSARRWRDRDARGTFARRWRPISETAAEYRNRRAF
jgi:hypothetical protein